MKDDRFYLIYIVERIERINRFVSGGKEEFLSSEMIQDAVVRNLQTMLESSQRISPALKDAHPEIPWPTLAGLRNVLVHGYLGLDLDVIWTVVERDLPALYPQIQALFFELGGNRPPPST